MNSWHEDRPTNDPFLNFIPVLTKRRIPPFAHLLMSKNDLAPSCIFLHAKYTPDAIFRLVVDR
jgi:hypothetical protein